jgi:hypothetical protein
MSVSAPAHARNLQTNINQSRYFFATQEAGEQELFLSTIGGGGPNGNISSLAVGISGPAGNAVVVSEGPSYMASEFISADQGAIFGSGSTYWTGSTIASTITGISLSSDRIPGSGLASIESYSGNGSQRGFEFLSRGVDSQVVSSINVNMNNYLSTIGKPGASATIGGNGECYAANSYIAPFFTSLNAQAGAGGRPCYGIQDLSGALGVTPEFRWAIGTSGVATGANAGSDLTIFSYNDDSSFNSAPLTIKRSDGAMAIQNISSILCEQGGTSKGQVFPMIADNTEFGAENSVFTIAGANSNAALYGLTFPVIFSTPVANLNPTVETLVNINFANALSTGSNHVNFKLGFSTATAYTNIVQTSYVPGGFFTPSDLPSLSTPLGHTNICAVLDPDGLDASGAGFLYVMGQLSDPNAAADRLFCAKGTVSEPQRNAFTYKTI